MTEDWPFDQAPNIAAITVAAIFDGAPILYVSHDADDHGWQFLDGNRRQDDDDARVIGMGSALARDQTLREIADLPPGWVAWREAVGRPWHRARHPIEMPVLADGRVVVRAPEPRDLPAIDDGMNDPDIVRWIGPAWPIEDFLPRTERMRDEGSPTFAICKGDGVCVGLVWVNIREDDPSSGYVGYWLLPVARGRGIATAAVRLISAWAPGGLGVTTVRLTTAPDNHRSQRVAERSGFGRAGVADNGDIVFELPAVEPD